MASTGLYQGKVKQCLSGDTIILQALNSRSEKQLSLAYVDAPRLGRDREDPFAFEARDIIRKALVGKVIQFRVLYRVPMKDGSQREFCQVTLQTGQQLPEVSISEGYLKLRDEAGAREENEDLKSYIDKLRALEARAKADSKGLWSSSGEKVSTSHEVPDPVAFVDKWKGKHLPALVEYVGAGDRMILRLKDSPTQHYQVPLMLAGIRAPRLQRKQADGVIVPGEPMGEESQDFANSRMLQRDCNVVLYGLSDQRVLIGSVIHPNGNIAVFLLREGLARCFDAHTTLMGREMPTLRQAEQQARSKQLGVFKGATAPRTSSRESDVVVSRIQTADTIYVRYPDGKERRFNLASIRAPKQTDPKQKPFQDESKEFMRRRLIGKHVKVAANGKRPAQDGYEERELATIVNNNTNIALSLVEAGYASVIRHKMDDTDRSPDYDALRLAEDAAQKEGKGMWSSKSPEAKAYVNYSEKPETAKRLLSLLQRQKRVPAIVDYISSGSRFRLLIPRENASITFVLSGAQIPRTARNDSETPEPFAREAYDLAIRRLQQRDVDIDVEENDKAGGFIGKLYINRDSFARVLIEEGYGTVRGRSAEKSGNLLELQAAEDKAKEGRKGMWHDYDPSAEAAATTNGDVDGVDATTNGVNGASSSTAAPWASAAAGGALEQAAPSTDIRSIYITHVDPSTLHLKYQTISSSTTTALDSLTSQLRSSDLSSQATPTADKPPKTGDTLLARFTLDNQWYRAKIRRVDREARTAEVLYADFGNSESLPYTSLRSLPSPERFGPTALGFQAKEAVLSFVSFPSGNEGYMSDAASWLSRRTQDGGEEGRFLARVDFTDSRDGASYLSVFDPTSQATAEDAQDNAIAAGSSKVAGLRCLNREIVSEGLGMVARKLQRWERAQGRSLKALRAAEEDAREAKLGMWEYGDLTGEEVEGAGAPKLQGGVRFGF